LNEEDRKNQKMFQTLYLSPNEHHNFTDQSCEPPKNEKGAIDLPPIEPRPELITFPGFLVPWLEGILDDIKQDDALDHNFRLKTFLELYCEIWKLKK
jgi:hypothetical protein